MYPLSPAFPSRGDLDWCWYLRREGRSGEALERVLHDIGVMHHSGWADWHPSIMTDTGSPVEMMFTADQSALVMRTEVADPAEDPISRVSKACALAARLGDAPPPPALREILSAAQATGDLGFGAWLGLRQDHDHLETTVFAEIPRCAADISGLLVPDIIAPAVDLAGGGARLRMLGYTAATGDMTLHFDTDRMAADIILALAAPADVPPEPLLDGIGALVTAAAAFGTPRSDLSFVYTIHKDNRPPALMIKLSSKALFGSDSVIEKMVPCCQGDPAHAYVGLVEQLTVAPDGQTHHGKIGLQARRDAGPALSIGVAAPWLCPLD